MAGQLRGEGGKGRTFFAASLMRLQGCIKFRINNGTMLKVFQFYLITGEENQKRYKRGGEKCQS